ncbi:hypothetical protein [Vibrio fluvialis]|uniref:hypothetical protein n=1 Tax=Vibrio fluvialis TaxID=676 RepID=UPI003D7E885F
MTNSVYQYQGHSGLRAIAEHVGIPFGTLSTRINHLGMSLEEAINVGDAVKSRRRCVYEYQGVRGLKNISKLVGIPAQTLSHRVYRGMSIDEAIAAGAKVSYPRKRKESGKRKEQVHKQAIQEGIRHPDLLDGHWKLALGMRA